MKPTQAQADHLTSPLQAFFDTQRHLVLGKIADGQDWWDDSWDDDLAGHLQQPYLDVSGDAGAAQTERLGRPADDYNLDQTEAFLASVAQRHAANINATTRQQVADSLASDAPDPAHVFDIAHDSRAPGIAAGAATFLAGFGTHEAASQIAYRENGTATKTWVTGDNPRPSHAQVDGETVGIDEVFSNGMPWPGQGGPDDSGCNCSIDVEVNVPSSQARMVGRRFFAKTRPADPRPLKVEALAPGVATMRLYDVIDSWGFPFGVSANDFAKMLDELPEATTQIQLHINSPGGESTEALAIVNMLRAHTAEVVSIVDGMAASAASVIACGAGRLVMLPNSQLMVHDAWGVCVGNAADMSKTAQILNQCSDNLAAVYAAKAGGSPLAWRAVLQDETWYSADEAVTVGLADEVGDPAKYPMSGDPPPEQPSKADFEEVAETFDLSGFKYQGRAQAPNPKTPVASASGQHKEGSAVVDLNDEQITNLRQKVGFAEDADADTIVAAVIEALDEQAEPQPRGVPEGHIAVPAAAWSDMQVAAQAGADAAERLRVQDREAFLEANKTKFAPANRAAWAKEYDRDPDGTRKHFETAPVIVPVDAIGHDEINETTEDDHIFAALFGETKGA